MWTLGRTALASGPMLIAILAATLASAANDAPAPCVGSPEAPFFCGDGGRAPAARLSAPFGVARLPGGGYLIADSGNNRVRRVSANGKITTVAGNGQGGFSGDGGPAVEAKLALPTGVSALPSGGFLIADSGNNRIREVAADGTITTVAGTGAAGYSGDGGPATSAQLRAPTNIAALSDDTFLIADNGNNRVRLVDNAGAIETVVGTGKAGDAGDGGPAARAQLNSPTSIATVKGGTFLIADSGNNEVREVTPNGLISTVAGSGSAGYSGDGTAATRAELAEPTGVTPYEGGFLIADTGNQVVRSVGRDGAIRTVAGTGTPGFGGDGLDAVDALLTAPTAVASTRGGFLIADNGNRRIRNVSDQGVIDTVAGSGPTSIQPKSLAENVAFPRRAANCYFDPHGLRAPSGSRIRASYIATDTTNVRLVLKRRHRTLRRVNDQAQYGTNVVGLGHLRRAGAYSINLTGCGSSDSQRLVVHH